jgi:hypothetical protein
MIPKSSHHLSAGGMAINWAVFGFIIAVLFAIALALPEQSTISLSKGLIITSAFAAILHGLVILYFSRSKKWQTAPIVSDGGGVKVLEYTISIVCWVLSFVLWWYGAFEATAAFLFVPTYFATSLVTFHICFTYFARREINKRALLLLAGNFWTLGYYIVIILRIRAKLESP